MNEFNLDREPKIVTGFTIPEKYFDFVNEKIKLQTVKKETKTFRLYYSKKRVWLGVAAIIILFISIPLYNFFTTSQEVSNTDALEEYISYNATISEDEIVNLLDNNDVEKLKINLNLQDKEIEDALDSNPNLEQYILD